MKEYTENELLHASEAETNTWVKKEAHVVLKEGKGEIEGIIDHVETSCVPNIPQSAEYLWVDLMIDGKRYSINTIKSLKLLE